MNDLMDLCKIMNEKLNWEEFTLTEENGALLSIDLGSAERLKWRIYYPKHRRKCSRKTIRRNK